MQTCIWNPVLLILLHFKIIIFLLKPWVLISKDKPNYSLAVAQLVSSGAQIQPPLTQGKMIEKGGGRGIFFFLVYAGFWIWTVSIDLDRSRT